MTWKLSLKIGVKPSKIIIKKLKGRWGSLTKDDVINLNVVLTSAPPKVRNYIIIHELCHLIVREHSRRYWSTVSKFMPNYEVSKKWLEQ
jgi:predicted metal-dependent hydrolase